MPKEWIVLCSVALLKSDGSCCWSLQMSDRERIAPIALYKRSTVSDSFRLIQTEERWERFTGGSSVDLLYMKMHQMDIMKYWNPLPTSLVSTMY